MENDTLLYIWPEWQIVKQIGSGSDGVVYEAVRRNHSIKSHSAIKVISIPQKESEINSLRAEGLSNEAIRDYLRRIVNDFEQAFQLMESFKGVQNIVSVEDYKTVELKDKIGWIIYIRMELLTPLTSYIRGKKIPEKEVIKMGIDICTALELCAQHDVIHRDIKPENILINKFGDFKLGDFSIARKMKNVTGSLSQKGTYLYMAPEVAKGNQYDATVDLYSLGLVLYRFTNNNQLPFMNTDRKPLTPDERCAANDRRLNGERLPIPCNASPEMTEIILCACDPDPSKRFASATEMKNALIAAENGTYSTAEGVLAGTVIVRKPEENNDHSQKATEATRNKSGLQGKKSLKIGHLILVLLVIAVLAGGGMLAIRQLFKNDIETTESAADAFTNDMEKADDGKDNVYSAYDKEQIAAIIAEADVLAADGDYEGALTKIKAALVTYPKSEELKSKETEYTEAFTAQVKAKKLEEANNLANSGDYIGAYRQIAEAIAIIGEDPELRAKATEYEDSYVSTTVIEINEYIEENDFNSAKNLLTTALAVFPTNQTLLAESEVLKNAMPKSIMDVCPPYKTKHCEMWTNLSMGGNKYAAGFSIGAKTGFTNWGEEGYALFNLSKKYRMLSFEVGNIDERGSETGQALYLYLDNQLVWSLDLDPEALPTRYDIDVSGATQMKFVGTGEAGDYGITNMVLFGNTHLDKDNDNQNVESGEDLLLVLPPYKTKHYEELRNISMGGNKYLTGFSIGAKTGLTNWGEEGYALFNLSQKYKTLSFEVGNIDERGSETGQALFLYLDDQLVWSLDLDPEALPTRYDIDVSGVSQVKFVGTGEAGDYGVANLAIK